MDKERKGREGEEGKEEVEKRLFFLQFTSKTFNLCFEDQLCVLSSNNIRRTKVNLEL